MDTATSSSLSLRSLSSSLPYQLKDHVSHALSHVSISMYVCMYYKKGANECCEYVKKTLLFKLICIS